MNNTQQITLDLSSKPTSQRIIAKQGDSSSRFIECILKNNSEDAEFESNVSAYFLCQKPDKTHVANSAELSGNVVKIELTDQCLTSAGVCDCEITLKEDEKVLTTATFQIMVQPSAYDEDSVESSDEYGIFTSAISQVDAKMEEIEEWSQTIETTLEEKTAADLQVQLNRINNNVSSVTQKTDQLQSGLTGVYTTLDVLKAAFPSGGEGVYVVQEDGHWYYWSGSAWTDGGVYMGKIINNSVNNDKIENFSIDPLKTKFHSESRNLLDPANMVEGTIQSTTSSSEFAASIVESTVYLSTLNHVPIQTAQAYITVGRCRYIFFYDSAMNVLECIDGTSSTPDVTASIPDDAAFFRCTIRASLQNLHEQYANYGKEILPYAPFEIQSDIKLSNQNLKQNKVLNYQALIDGYYKAKAFKTGKNLINEELYEEGYIYKSDEITKDGNYRTSIPVVIEPSTEYTINTVRNIMLYDDNFLPVAYYDFSGSPSYTLTTTKDTRFIRVSYPSDSNVQLELGPDSTSYEKYSFEIAQNINVLCFKDKNMLFAGDSICSGEGYSGGYASMISELTGANITNIAMSGGTIAQIDDRSCISQSLQDQSSDYDYVILQGGTNDILYSELGTLEQFDYAPSMDISTFTGGLESLLTTAIKTYAGKKIGYIICHNMSSRNAELQSQFNERIRECCKKWSIPYLDLYNESGMNTNLQQIRDSYTSTSTGSGGDGTHPNQEGYSKYYVPKIIAWLKTL